MDIEAASVELCLQERRVHAEQSVSTGQALLVAMDQHIRLVDIRQPWP